MERFIIGTTLVCSVNIKEAGVDSDPDTSVTMKVVRIQPKAATIVDYAAASQDDTGDYHYDWDTSGNIEGIYRVLCKTVDGDRTTIDESDEFELVEL